MNKPNSYTSLEILVPKLGEVLVRESIISDQQLKDALKEQDLLKIQGNQKHLGAILVEKGWISGDTLDQTITNQILR